MPKSNNTYKTHPHMTSLLEAEIYERRKRLGMSQYALAEKAGVARNSIDLMERHKRIPKMETIFDIIMALDFSVEEREVFAVKHMDAYYKDKEVQKQLEKEPVGAV